jgi:hypothetical protein
MLTRIPNLSLIVLFSFLLSSCGAIVKVKAKKYATVQEGAIPEDFGTGNVTMLFITKSKKSYDKYLKKNVERCYQGKYELITHKTLEQDQYQDLETYPYYFDFGYKTYQRFTSNEVIHGPGGTRLTSGMVRKFFIIDRKTDKKYEMGMTSSYWSKLQRMYIKNLEAERLKNSGELPMND